MDPFANCRICPRKCGANRMQGERGVCRMGSKITAARASLHVWEEPCLSGRNGSGTVFFTGCNLGCVYCQNAAISHQNKGKEITPERLCDIFFALKEQGAQNINLVTATHFLPLVLEVVKKAKDSRIGIPFVYNCSGYENVEMLKRAEGLFDIYLPDFKYRDPLLSGRLSGAYDYPVFAEKALFEMVNQRGEAVFDEEGMMIRGVIV